MRFQHLISCAVVLAATSAAAAAQVNPVPRVSAPQAIQAAASDISASVARGVGPSVLASITAKDKVVTGSLGTTFGVMPDVEANPWFKGSGPVDEDDATSPVMLADLSGLRSATKVAAGVNFVWWDWEARAPEQHAFCRRTVADPQLAPDSITDVLQAAAESLPNTTTVAARRRVRDSVLTHLSEKVCSRHRIPDSQRAAFDDLVDFGRVWLFGISGELGRATYRYADTLAASFSKQTEEPWAAGIGAGLYMPTARVLLAGTLRYEHGFEGGTPRQYCIPIGTAGATQCRTVALGPPEEGNPMLLTVETRWFANEHVGFSPRMTADLAEERGFGVEVPILLRQESDKGFTSALALGWRSKATAPDTDDRAYVSLTVGVTFGIGLQLR